MSNTAPNRPGRARFVPVEQRWSPIHARRRLAAGLALLLGLAVLGWLLARAQRYPGQMPLPAPQPVAALTTGAVARMDSPIFHYDAGWTVTAAGADPWEPADAWNRPAGVVEFDYTGRELALQLAVGRYWAYVFVTVDGRPANQLPVLAGNTDSLGQTAGYLPLYAPEAQPEGQGPVPRWVPVHRTASPGPHQVRVEMWRGWGQRPLRAVAVDALPPDPLPLWPAMALLLAALWCGLAAGGQHLIAHGARQIRRRRPLSVPYLLPETWSLPLAGLGVLLAIGGTVLGRWTLTVPGLALLGLAGWQRPALWTAALLFGLPAYLHPLPILPNRALNLVEIGVWGGLALAGARWLLGQTAHDGRPITQPPTHTNIKMLAALASLALVSAFAAQHLGIALREWRTVFLAATAFALLLNVAGARHCRQPLHDAQSVSGSAGHPGVGPGSERWLLVWAWLAGGTAVALIGLWQYVSGQMLISAEGVQRVRALYGSPNNLALYLDRTAAVGLALALFADRRRRWPAVVLVLPQVAALLLTFSKGAILLGLPTMLGALWLGGLWLSRRRGLSPWPFWWLAAVTLAITAALLPFLDTDRFRRLLDFSQGTTGFLRLHLWRSAWQMALDHPWLGVGPDNFLYAYRSGYILPAAWQDPNLNHPHNWFLDWWTRLGLPGLFLALAWVGVGLRGIWEGLQRGEGSALSLGLLVAAVTALAHGLIDASYALPDLMLVWVLMFEMGSASAVPDTDDKITTKTPRHKG